jgi:uncharacterized protein (TIGR00255 family)
MLKSMTAYGRGEAEVAGQKWVVELRSLNHRFLELVLNLPRRLWALEDRVRKLIKGGIQRGRVEMQLTWEGQAEAALKMRLDQGLVAAVQSVLQELQGAAGLPEPLRLDHFLHFTDDIVVRERETLDLEEIWAQLTPGVEQALARLEEMRLTEGAALAAELANHLELVRQECSRIADRAPQLPQLWRERVTARLAEIPEITSLDEARLAQEVAMLAERRDLTEELARLESHVGQFQQTLQIKGAVGRKLEFLQQEMLREVNTIGSKAGDLEIAQSVLEIKGTLERLREQIQNIE